MKTYNLSNTFQSKFGVSTHNIIIITGDFNANLLVPSRPETSILINLIENHAFSIVSTESTHNNNCPEPQINQPNQFSFSPDTDKQVLTTIKFRILTTIQISENCTPELQYNIDNCFQLLDISPIVKKCKSSEKKEQALKR